MEKEKEIRDDQMVVVLEDGTELVCDIIFTHEANDKNYVVFAFPDNDEISAAVYVPGEDGTDGEFLDIETDEEWNMLDELLDAYFDELDALEEEEDE
ncbi:DUF1292 domain-containing protein [Acholeplasma sp. OttesenSCG-928-E16]|nr:DUF1292 domain-containing protein [Acholeplasma sp. OttesenSCG-928-E16]